MLTVAEFSKKIQARLHPDFYLHSRLTRTSLLHRLNVELYIKREDEIGGLGGGTKFRKYASLLPWLKANQFTCALLIGGAYSNHLSALVPLLIEAQIEPIVFVRGEASLKLKGNFLLLRTFLPSQNIHFIPRANWRQAQGIAEQTRQAQNRMGKKTIIIPEGAAMPPAFWGSCSLFLDILQNEQYYQKDFNHIFIDSGTGFTASALALCNHYFQTGKQIHIQLTAGAPESFSENLAFGRQIFANDLGSELTLPDNFTLYPPLLRFGKINSAMARELIRIARKEGILTDPIYTLKLFLSVQQIIERRRLSGNILAIHTGGLASVWGYDSWLAFALGE
jgi:1-aminocyclopropane-1-carboxylate deaminase/D-cysteine desulfhydrase-like pyridoxal-dependent ACC family enzyme